MHCSLQKMRRNWQRRINIYMKPKVTRSQELVKVSESELLSLVASKLKGRVLFPQKVADAKKYLKKVQVANL